MSWQDLIVSAVALGAGLLVLWRTFGAWKDSSPGAPGSPHCESCAVASLVREPEKRPDRQA